MIDYKKGKIYKLVSNQTDNVYYGSTCQELCERKSGHMRCFRKYMNGKGNYVTSFEITKFDDCEIIWVENWPCNNKHELLARERHWIENNECVNKIIPTRTRKEYREMNKDKIAQKKKEYYAKNKDKVTQKKKEYYAKNKDKVAQIVKKYNEANKDIIAKKMKEYSEANKEELKKKRSKQVECVCGSLFQYGVKARHERSKKHQDYLALSTEN